MALFADKQLKSAVALFCIVAIVSKITTTSNAAPLPPVRTLTCNPADGSSASAPCKHTMYRGDQVKIACPAGYNYMPADFSSPAGNFCGTALTAIATPCTDNQAWVATFGPAWTVAADANTAVLDNRRDLPRLAAFTGPKKVYGRCDNGTNALYWEIEVLPRTSINTPSYLKCEAVPTAFATPCALEVRTGEIAEFPCFDVAAGVTYDPTSVRTTGGQFCGAAYTPAGAVCTSLVAWSSINATITEADSGLRFTTPNASGDGPTNGWLWCKSSTDIHHYYKYTLDHTVLIYPTDANSEVCDPKPTYTFNSPCPIVLKKSKTAVLNCTSLKTFGPADINKGSGSYCKAQFTGANDKCDVADKRELWTATIKPTVFYSSDMIMITHSNAPLTTAKDAYGMCSDAARGGLFFKVSFEGVSTSTSTTTPESSGAQNNQSQIQFAMYLGLLVATLFVAAGSM